MTRTARPRISLCRSLALLALTVALLPGCATPLPGTRVDTADGHAIEYSRIDAGTPSVVFLSGFASPMGPWGKVFPEIGRSNTVFAYNRPGYGDSAAATTPRDGATIAAELRALLRTKNIKPPYVLVGHSLGGLYAQYYARSYPDDVAGMVLVDSSHPAQFAQGPAAPPNWPWWARMWVALLPDSKQNELSAAQATGEALGRLPPLAGKPVVILSAWQKGDNAAYFEENQNDLARMYPGCRHTFVESGHFIQWEKPAVVLEAIREVAATGTAATH